jgi:NAD(P)H dehydrogenase (quinone)
MLIQVIHCHPLTDSYNHALFETVVSQLKGNGHQVAPTDLYAERFDPVMTAEERRSYYEPPYRTAAFQAHVDLLRRIDGVIFCFPHWWFSMPAVLKGYVDRVWGPGIAFDTDERGHIKPLLTHIKLFGVVTSYGQPWWMVRVHAGDPGRKVLMHALKPPCGKGVRCFYLAHYNMDRSTPASRETFIGRVRSAVARI